MKEPAQNSNCTKLKRVKNPHAPTFSFLVSPCTYYFDHFSCTSSDSIYTIDIPPRVRNLHNQFLYAIPFKLLLFFTFLVFLVKSDKCDPTILSAIHESKFSVQHLFFNFSLPHT